MRPALVLAVLLSPVTTAFGQESPTRQPFSPLSGPNTAIQSPVCDVINFGFCPQPPVPPPPLPDPEADTPPPPPMSAPPHRRRGHHRHVVQNG